LAVMPAHATRRLWRTRRDKRAIAGRGILSAMLIVLGGLPGAGKSTLALDLGQALNCAVLGVDQAEAAMWRAGVSRSGPRTMLPTWS
jgi:predicted ATP-dependent serine protease